MSIKTVYYAFSSAKYLNMFLLRYSKALNIGGGRKNIPVWAFYQRCKNAVCHENSLWYHCTICHPEESHHISEGRNGVVLYTRLKTYSVHNHIMSPHPCDHKALTRFYDGKMWHYREEILMIQWSSQMRRNVEDSNSSISSVSDFMITTKKDNKVHKQQASFEETIVALMGKAYTPLS